MSVVPQQIKLTPRATRPATMPVWARASFAAYLAWNILWLASGKLPPSMLLGIVGIPCPTTGFTRSLASLLHGDVRASLLWNPFTIPFLILLALSFHKLSLAALRKKEILLPKWMAAAWLITLIAAWFSKFLLGRAYW
jgi:hypothetical protein